ncbi:MAG: DndE family protein [Bacteroidota bacterium]
MLSTIKTSRENKEIVSQLTRRLNLGAENIIARIALSYSISKERKMDLKLAKDSGGKEYSPKVLFGDYLEYYIALVCVHYNLPKNNHEVARYIKMHIDDGLSLINNEIENNPNITGSEFLISKIERGVKAFH